MSGLIVAELSVLLLSVFVSIVLG